MLMKQTLEHGTIMADTFEIERENTIGIVLGVFGKDNCLSIEENDQGLCILLNDDAIRGMHIKVLHADKNWNIKGEI